MRHQARWLVAAALLALTACHGEPRPEEEEESVGTSTRIEGDSTLYGLACRGCTDSVLVFLPGQGGDPVEYDILTATKRRRVMGHPQVGDWVAVLRSAKDSAKADMVIDLDQLKGTWVTRVWPTAKERLVRPDEPADVTAEQDSLLQELMKPVEIGFALKRHYTAQPVGRQRQRLNSEESPVTVPVPRNYTAWHVFNGRLVLTHHANPMDATSAAENDTADFVLLTRDSLRLRFKDGERGYYRQ